MYQSFDDYQNNLEIIGKDIFLDKLSTQELEQVLEQINSKSINESLFKKLFGAVTGILLGEKIMQIILKTLDNKSGIL